MKKFFILSTVIVIVVFLTSLAVGEESNEIRPRGVPPERWIRISDNFGLAVSDFKAGSAADETRKDPSSTPPTTQTPPSGIPEVDALQKQLDDP